MIKLGLTGPIGSGKSSIAQQAEQQLGIPVFDADKTVHALYATDTDLQRFLTGICGPDILQNGNVDRQKLGTFMRTPGNEDAWKNVETEVHRRLWQSFDTFAAAQEEAGKQIVIADVPLLFEKKSETKFDYTINVSVPPAVQKQRALSRAVPKLTEEEFDKRNAAFMSMELRNAKADFIIDNTGEVSASVLQLRACLAKIKDKSAKFKPIQATFHNAAVYVGTFDPMTLGHVDVIKSAAHMPYQKLYIGVGVNPGKNPMFRVEERIQMIEREMDRDVRPYLPPGREIIVTAYEGLTVDFMKKVGASLCVRGVRGIKDLEEENDLAAVNRSLYAENAEEFGSGQFVQAYFVTSDPKLRHVSSSFARGICTMGPERDVSLLEFVSPDIAAKMIAKRNWLKNGLK